MMNISQALGLEETSFGNYIYGPITKSKTSDNAK